jgi:hydroxypyruvate reductase
MMQINSAQQRRQLLEMYQAALRAVGGEQAVSAYLNAHLLEGQWAVVAVGKAAAAMAVGAQGVLGGQLHGGLVITKYGHADPRLDEAQFEVLESGHPVPDETSLLAGEVLLNWLDRLPDDMPLLFLLSGGASALVEALPQGVALDELERGSRWLLASGLAIEQMNSVRQRLSRIKGGRLARHLGGRRCLQLIISDVPGDDLATIGSAPLHPSPEAPLPESLPAWLHALMDEAEHAPAVDDPVFSTIETHIVASNATARHAAVRAAQAQGLQVHDHSHHFQGQTQELAREFVQELLQGEPGVYLWGGEGSVILPPEPGRGGRNQHMALVAASHLAGHENILLLAAGTDGSDGPGEEAGALVDGATKARGEQEGFSLDAALGRADSGRFLEASGDLIETGPTGTNVMDLVIGWKWDEG